MEKLTNREQEVLELLVQGLSNTDIAETLYLSVHTVKANLENIYDKIGIHNRVLIGIYYYKHNQEKFSLEK